MGQFTLIGVDAATGEPVTMPVRMGSVTEAAEFGAARGMTVQRVESEASGAAYTVTGGGISKCVPTDSAKHSDAAMFVLSAAVPIVGLIAGCVRIGTGRSGGGAMIAAALLGSLVVLMLIQTAA